MTYKGFRGDRPMITAFKEVPLIVYHKFKEGNRDDGHVRAIEAVFEVIRRINERGL
jgi:hypothetical protein